MFQELKTFAPALNSRIRLMLHCLLLIEKDVCISAISAWILGLENHHTPSTRMKRWLYLRTQMMCPWKQHLDSRESLRIGLRMQAPCACVCVWGILVPLCVARSTFTSVFSRYRNAILNFQCQLQSTSVVPGRNLKCIITIMRTVTYFCSCLLRMSTVSFLCVCD